MTRGRSRRTAASAARCLVLAGTALAAVRSVHRSSRVFKHCRGLSPRRWRLQQLLIPVGYRVGPRCTRRRAAAMSPAALGKKKKIKPTSTRNAAVAAAASFESVGFEGGCYEVRPVTTVNRVDAVRYRPRQIAKCSTENGCSCPAVVTIALDAIAFQSARRLRTRLVATRARRPPVRREVAELVFF